MQNKARKTLRIVTEIERSTAVVTVLDCGGIRQAEQLREPLQRLVDQGLRNILVRMGNIHFCGAVAVGAVLAGFVRTLPLSVNLRLIALGAEASRAMNGHGLTDLLDSRRNHNAKNSDMPTWRTIPVTVEADLPIRVRVATYKN